MSEWSVKRVLSLDKKIKPWNQLETLNCCYIFPCAWNFPRPSVEFFQEKNYWTIPQIPPFWVFPKQTFLLVLFFDLRQDVETQVATQSEVRLKLISKTMNQSFQCFKIWCSTVLSLKRWFYFWNIKNFNSFRKKFTCICPWIHFRKIVIL